MIVKTHGFDSYASFKLRDFVLRDVQSALSLARDFGSCVIFVCVIISWRDGARLQIMMLLF